MKIRNFYPQNGGRPSTVSLGNVVGGRGGMGKQGQKLLGGKWSFGSEVLIPVQEGKNCVSTVEGRKHRKERELKSFGGHRCRGQHQTLLIPNGGRGQGWPARQVFSPWRAKGERENWDQRSSRLE